MHDLISQIFRTCSKIAAGLTIVLLPEYAKEDLELKLGL